MTHPSMADGGRAAADALNRGCACHNVDRARLLHALAAEEGVAEAWLAAHPDDPALLVTLGQLCRNEQIWGKAEEYLQRALALGARAEAWEELGHVHAAQHHDAKARDAYARALAMQRDEAVAVLPDRSLRELIAGEAVAETRSSMGVPLLSLDELEPGTPLRD